MYSVVNLPTPTQPLSTKPEASVSSKGTSLENADTSPSSEPTFQNLLQQKGQKLVSANMSELLEKLQPNIPFEIPTESISETPLCQELAAAMLSTPVILPQIQQLTDGEPSPLSSSVISVPLAQQLPTSQPESAVSSNPSLQTEVPFLNQHQMQVRSISTVSVLQQDAQPVSAFALQPYQSSDMTNRDFETAVFQGDTSLSKPLFENPLELPVKVGETPVLNTASSDFDLQLGKQLSSSLEQGAQTVAVKLAPEHLGTMVVEFTYSQDGSLHVILQASNPKAASLLNQHTAGLNSLLQSNTQAPVYVEVQQQDSSQSYQEQSQHQNQGHSNSQQESQHQKQQKQTQDFLEQLRLGMVSLDTEAS